MITEVYGPPDTGKSSYALNLIEDDQISLYINADRHLTKDYIKNNMFVLQSNNIEEILEIVKETIANLDVIILDSLPTITLCDNLDNDSNKIITKVQKLISICNRNKCDLIIVNQERFSNKHENNTYGISRLRIYYNKRIKIEK